MPVPYVKQEQHIFVRARCLEFGAIVKEALFFSKLLSIKVVSTEERTKKRAQEENFFTAFLGMLLKFRRIFLF